MKEEILKMLRETDGYISGQELCNKFGVSRTAIWKVMKQLKEAGYNIEAQQNKGYHIVSAPDVMDAAELKSIWKPKWVGCEILYFDSIDSTNTKAQELAEKGYPSGTLVVADKQIAGKGRRGRNWESPSGCGIFMTLMLKPDINPNNASMLTLVSALAVAKALADITGKDAKIKWPNDIIINGKKLVGILTEMSSELDNIHYVVIGIGINVNTDDFPENIASVAASMHVITGAYYKRAEIIADTWKAFEKYYDLFVQTENLALMVDAYNQRLVNMDRRVMIEERGHRYEGTARGIDAEGALLVERDDGTTTSVISGEVSVRGVLGYV